MPENQNPVGNPPLSEATLTSHLENFDPPKQTDAEVAAEELSDELEGFKLPKTLKAAHELLGELQSSKPADASEEKVKSAKIAAVVAQISKLGEGSKVSEISAADRKWLNAAQSGHADKLKIRLLAQSHPEVRGLLEKNAGLEKQILELKKKQ